MIDEEKAEEYVKELILKHNRDVVLRPKNAVTYIDELKQAYLDGITEGKPKWHNLRKNQNDLPKEGVEVLVLYSNTYANGLVVNKYTLRYEVAKYINDEEDVTEWYWVGARTDDIVDEVIAWCELPRFEEM